MNKVFSVLVITALIALLVTIRVFETSLFYDPLTIFFKTNHTISVLPEVGVFKLYLSLVFRYLLNSLISLAILWYLFKNVSLLKFSTVLYVGFLILCLIIFTFFYISYPEGPHQPLFYARRFLIQPLLLLLLVPAFYFFGNITMLKK